MSLTYASYVATLANLAVEDQTDPNFVQILPSVISYAENRIYRDADLLSTVVRNSSGSILSNTRSFTLPVPSQGPFNVVRQINIFYPAGSTSADGQRIPLTPVSTEVMDMLWPSTSAQSSASIPMYFCMETPETGVFGPPPGQNYAFEVLGTITPETLSASNTETYLTEFLPDLFLAASMVFVSGWQKNFGSQADNPAQAVSWEGQYKTLFQGVDLVDARQKFSAVSWTSSQPEPYASAGRG